MAVCVFINRYPGMAPPTRFQYRGYAVNFTSSGLSVAAGLPRFDSEQCGRAVGGIAAGARIEVDGFLITKRDGGRRTYMVCTVNDTRVALHVKLDRDSAFQHSLWHHSVRVAWSRLLGFEMGYNHAGLYPDMIIAADRFVRRAFRTKN